MEKVILNKEQYDAINDLINSQGLDSSIKLALFKIEEKIKWKVKRYKTLNDLSNQQLLQALYVGFEVEEIKEEKLLSMYNRGGGYILKENKNSYKAGIKECLDIIGIKIKGINE